MRVGVFHPGTQHSWQTALAFQEAGLLAWYATSVFYDPARWPYKVEKYIPAGMSKRINREFRRRQFTPLDPARVRQFGWWEWSEVFLRRLGWQHLANRCNERGNPAFCEQMIRLIEREPVDVLWGFDTSSLEVFRWARQRGIRCILDQTIGHPAALNRVMMEERERHPHFFAASYRPFDQTCIERQNEETTATNLVVVGSDFCARTMIENGCPPEKIAVIHYGYDESLFPVEKPLRSLSHNRPVRFLFAGEVGPRKGIAYLLQAFENVPSHKAQLTLVGRMAIPQTTFGKFAGRVQHVPQVSRSEVVRYFTEADCFVFPSLFEGSGIVLYEACGAGLGSIQSDRCGGEASLRQNGHVLKEITVPALIKAIEAVVEDPGICERWQAASWAEREKHTWRGYRRNIAGLVSHQQSAG